MSIAICNYVRFKTRDGLYVQGYDFQNFYVDEVRVRDSVAYRFAPLGVTAGAGTKGGDRTGSALVGPAGPLSMNIFTEASRNDWLCEISVVLLDPETFSEVVQITKETWTCSKPETTTERAVLRLSSPLDAVDGQAPRRTLSSVLVGSLPATGSLSVS